MLVIGGPPTFAGGGMPQRIHDQLLLGARISYDRCGIIRKQALHRRKVADVTVDDSVPGTTEATRVATATVSFMASPGLRSSDHRRQIPRGATPCEHTMIQQRTTSHAYAVLRPSARRC
jgi:hypothetical protein